MHLETVKLGAPRNKDETQANPEAAYKVKRLYYRLIRLGNFKHQTYIHGTQMFFKYALSSFIVLFSKFNAGAPKFHICFANTAHENMLT